MGKRAAGAGARAVSEHALPLAMAATALAGILAGYRVAMVLAGSAALFLVASDLPGAFFRLLVSRIYANALANWLLVAIPMFILMGLILEKSGVAERALTGAQRALGGSAAGMGVAVLLVGVLLAASSGVVGASVVLLTLLALPRMEAAGYDLATSSGLVAASGTLAILMPPSVMLIVLGDQLQAPVPRMFAGAVLPGLLLVALYGAWVAWRARGLPRRAGEGLGLLAGIGRTLLDVAPLLALVVAVLGSIVAGIATPTEASGLGACGAALVAAAYGRLRWAVLWSAARDTAVATSMVILVIVGATCFSAVFKGIGGDDMVAGALGALGGGAWTTLIVMMGAVFALGFVLDWLEITLILVPILAPVVAGLDFGNGLSGTPLMVWFGILVAVNLQTSFLTPPFGFALFYLRGASEGRVPTGTIYRGVAPFVALQLVALAAVMAMPGLVV